MKTRNSSVEEFMKSPETHLMFETVDLPVPVIGYSFNSDLERLVQGDMKKHGINYPYCSVDDVKAYWKQRLS